MMDLDLIQRLAVATGIGLLVGVERGWRERTAEAGSRTAGIRTFTLTGLLGGVVGAIASALREAGGGGIVIAAAFVAFGAAFTLFKYRESEADQDFSVTTVVAAIATFALGCYALIGDVSVAAGAGVAMVLVLAFRAALHGWLQHLTWQELRAGVVLAAMTFLALPIIPDQRYGPYGGVNPRQIWLIAVVLAAVSFVGYLAAKRFGPRGLLVGAAAGGVVSSTAVALDAARRAAAREAKLGLLAAAATLATAVSFVRTLAVIAVLNATVAKFAALPLLAAAAAAVALSAFFARANLRSRAGPAIKLRNPFSLLEVVALALLLGAAIFVTQALAAWFGSVGALLGSAIAGAADVDAATVSMAELGRRSLSPMLAASGILLALLANNLLKLLLALFAGTGPFAARLAVGVAVPLGVGAAVAVAVMPWL